MPDGEWKAPIDITKEQWMSLLRDEKTITEKDRRLLKALYDCPGCKATSIQLAQLLGMSEKGPFVNIQVGKLGQKIIDKLNISWPKEYRKFNVPFSGEQRMGKIYWILRPELQEAMQEIDEW